MHALGLSIHFETHKTAQKAFISETNDNKQSRANKQITNIKQELDVFPRTSRLNYWNATN